MNPIFIFSKNHKLKGNFTDSMVRSTRESGDMYGIL